MVSAKVGLRSTILERVRAQPAFGIFRLNFKPLLTDRSWMNNLVLIMGVTEKNTQSGWVFPGSSGNLTELREKLTRGQPKCAVLLWILSKYPMVTWRSYENVFLRSCIRLEWPLAAMEVKFQSCAQAEMKLRRDWRKCGEHYQLHIVIWGLTHDKGVTCSQTHVTT